MTGNGKILSLKGEPGKRDKSGRLLRHNATIEEVHQIAVEEADKIHQFYMEQIPAFVARMIQDALIGYGLLTPVPGTDIVPQSEAASVSPPVVGSDSGGSHSAPNPVLAAKSVQVSESAEPPAEPVP